MRILIFVVALSFATAVHAAVPTPAEEKEVLAAMAHLPKPWRSTTSLPFRNSCTMSWCIRIPTPEPRQRPTSSRRRKRGGALAALRSPMPRSMSTATPRSSVAEWAVVPEASRQTVRTLLPCGSRVRQGGRSSRGRQRGRPTLRPLHREAVDPISDYQEDVGRDFSRARPRSGCRARLSRALPLCF